jgi:hypothetical protein
MNFPAQLLQRLDAIGQSLERTGLALALLGLGSVGVETARLDEYSDLDFFAIVQPGHKHRFIHNLDWLSTICPIAYHFQNSSAGHKLLFADGIFCEMAVFEPAELADIPYAEVRVIWQAPGLAGRVAMPARRPAPTIRSVEWMLGEALTCVYVGLGRYRRGEKLSAQRFIQHYAVDRLIELSAQLETPQPAFTDVFAIERRYEARFPTLAAELSRFIQGYERSPESARAIVAFLDQHFAINPALKAKILELC